MKKALALLITIVFAAYINPMLIDKNIKHRKLQEKGIISGGEEILIISSAEVGDYGFIYTNNYKGEMFELSFEWMIVNNPQPSENKTSALLPITMK